MREGWKCPVCGKGIAPDVKSCEHGVANPTIPPQLPLAPLDPNIPYGPSPWYTPWGPARTID